MQVLFKTGAKNAINMCQRSYERENSQSAVVNWIVSSFFFCFAFRLLEFGQLHIFDWPWARLNLMRIFAVSPDGRLVCCQLGQGWIRPPEKLLKYVTIMNKILLSIVLQSVFLIFPVTFKIKTKRKKKKLPGGFQLTTLYILLKINLNIIFLNFQIFKKMFSRVLYFF